MISAALADSLRHLTDSLTKKIAPDTPAPSPETGDGSAAYVKRLREGMKAIREHLRRMAAALAAGATAVLAGLGYTQIHQLFPLPEDLGTTHPFGEARWFTLWGHELPPSWLLSISGKTWLELVALFGAVAAPVGAAWLAGRFFGAQRRIPISAAEGLGGHPSPEETTLADRVLAEYARTEEAESLRALDLRSIRFRHIARGLREDRRKKYEAEATRIDSVLERAMVEAAAEVLERRAEKAFRGGGTLFALALAGAGIVALFGAADVSKGHRDLIELRQKCGEALEKSPDACDPVRSSEQRRAITLGQEAIQAKNEKERQDAVKKAASLAPGAKKLYKKVVACSELLKENKKLKDASESVRTAAITACAQSPG